MRKFEETKLTKLFVAGLKARARNLRKQAETNDDYRGEDNSEIAACNELVKRIESEGLDVTLVPREY
jgi:hypothetical protein